MQRMKNLLTLVFIFNLFMPVYSMTATVEKIGVSSSVIPQSAKAIQWWRYSAERKAEYRQIFMLAGKVIQQKVMQNKLKPHTWGVIIDIDETILDNSQWNEQHDLQGNSETWDDFAAKGISIRTPGAKALLNSVHAMGGYINLVTNRSEALRKITEKNLRVQGLYFDQILFSADSSNWYPDKNSRFVAIINGTSPSRLPAQIILAWLGDNIQDFPNLKQTNFKKFNGENAVFDQFGDVYFSLPNPMYGSWE